MRKILFIVVFILLVQSLFSEETIKDSTEYDPLDKHFAFYESYSNNLHSSNRINIGVAIPITSHYLINTDIIHITWENQDRFNRMKRSTSLFSLFDIGSSLAFGLLFSELAMYDLFPVYLTNSTHNFYILGNPEYTYKKEKIGPNIALFVKNNTDLYLFRKNNWLELSPGAGVKLFVYGAGIDIGYERRHQFVAEQRPKYVDGFFFNITIHGLY